jgi:hypothetical protein
VAFLTAGLLAIGMTSGVAAAQPSSNFPGKADNPGKACEVGMEKAPFDIRNAQGFENMRDGLAPILFSRVSEVCG